jgi:lipopolysaccharide/colanic/teichoic acid biosynthesis glycosyltransferase
MRKRLLDVILGGLGLVAAVPVLLVIRGAMYLSGDRGPFLYRAIRVGEHGRPITVFKVRTMDPASRGTAVTVHDDPRVTPLGRLVRRTRLDELPQLWNVVRGEMSLVGPRPEDPVYVDLSLGLHRRVFTERPGITGLAQLVFHDEAALLQGPDPDRIYREEVLPAKLLLDAEYLDRRSVRLDLEILARTVLAVIGLGGGRH